MGLYPGDSMGWDKEEGQCLGLFELSLLGITSLGSPVSTDTLFLSALLLLVSEMCTYMDNRRNRHSC